MRTDQPVSTDLTDPPRKLEYLEHALRRSRAGAELARVFEAHVEEVLWLINHNRRVAVTWQRNQGPAFIRAAVDSGFEGDVVIPQAVNDVQLEELLLRMADALQRYGSLELRRTIAEQSLLVLRWAREIGSLHDLFARLDSMDREGAT